MQATFLARRISIEGQLHPCDVLVPLLLKHISNHSVTTIISDVLPVYIFFGPLSYKNTSSMTLPFLKATILGPFPRKGCFNPFKFADCHLVLALALIPLILHREYIGSSPRTLH